MADITGTEGSDTLVGTAGDDTINGLGGYDQIDGKAGNDKLYGGDGSGQIEGGTGSDLIVGGSGFDYLSDNGNGSDTLLGGGGDDNLSIGHYGSNASETLRLEGGDGNDTAYLGTSASGTTSIDMGTGADKLTIASVGTSNALTVTLGAGQDTVLLSRYASLGSGAVFTDFAAGASGDLLDIADYLSQALTGWDGSNPFGPSGYLRLVQYGSNAALQIDRDGAGGAGGFATLLNFNNTAAAALTAENFGGYVPRAVSAADAATAYVTAPVSVLEGADTAISLTITLKNVAFTSGMVEMTFLPNQSTVTNGEDVSVPSYAGSFYVNQSPTGTYTLTVPSISVLDDLLQEGAETLAVKIRVSGQIFDSGTDTTIVSISLLDGDKVGTGGGDSLIGSNGRDYLSGLAGDDLLRGGIGNDLLAGGAGVDAAVFSGARSGYRLVYLGGDMVRVSGPDGVDTLTGVERLRFADGTVAVPTTLFDPIAQAASNFGRSPTGGNWSSANTYPRAVADVNGDGRADVVGFGVAGTYVAVGRGDGTFGDPTLAVRQFGAGTEGGGWTSQDRYPRVLADVNGDGRADVVGFGLAGTYTALGRADGTFGDLTLAVRQFGAGEEGGKWTSQDRYPRTLADVNGDGRADIVGFGEAGAYVALGKADGTFGNLVLAVGNFGAGAGGWISQDRYPRAVADVNGDGRADIIGFGEPGTYIALGRADGTFGDPTLAVTQFGAGAAGGGWTSLGQYPRAAADVNGDGAIDLVGFGVAGTYVSLNDGQGRFAAPVLAAAVFGTDPSAGGWSSNDLYPRVLADVDGDGRADIIGFGENGVFVATASAFDPVAAGMAAPSSVDADAAAAFAVAPAFELAGRLGDAGDLPLLSVLPPFEVPLLAIA